jgi:benzylsuccinate CoA-transferase BbsF subunit
LGGVFHRLHVLDFSWVAAGPIHTKYLADFGATVVKIESANRPDMLRQSAPFKDQKPGLDRSGYYAIYNTNKLSLSLDLKHPKAKEIVKKLVAWSDVVAESFVPGTMEAWGFGYENLKKIKPDIIMFRTCQMGQTGPLAKQPGYGPMLAAFSGFTNITGWPDRPPVQPHGAHSDFIAPRMGTAALVAALLHRRKTGQGQCLDLSQLEASIHFLAPLFLDYGVNGRQMTRRGNASPFGAPCGIFRCKGEDQWCALEIISDEAWEAFCRLTDDLGWPRDPKFATAFRRKENEEELNRLLESLTVQFSPEELMMRLQSVGIITGVAQNPQKLLSDPQLNHYRFFWWMDHPEMGRFPYHGQAMRLSRTPCEPKSPSPCLGQHTEYVCCGILGMSGEEFTSYLEEGVFGQFKK